jgi:hypothetical protein
MLGSLRGRATLAAGCVAAVLASDAAGPGSGSGPEAPLLELAALGVEVETARGTADAALGAGLGPNRVALRVSAALAANVYSADFGGWEPVVEPWCATGELGASLPGCASSDLRPVHLQGNCTF